MKTILVIFITVLISSCSNQIYRSKLNSYYKPLSSFKTDSLAPLGSDTADYLQYNFIKHKDKYIGKKFKEIERDFKMDIYQITTMPIYNDLPFSDNAIIHFYNYMWDKTGVYFNLIIHFSEKFNTKKFRDIQKRNNYLWSKEQSKFLRNMIIKDIIITDSRTWKK